MSASTPSMPRFHKTQNDTGYVSWKCNYCGWRTQQPQYPKSHNCGNRGGGRTRSGSGRGRGGINSEERESRVSDNVREDVSDNAREDVISESDSYEQPSPFNINASSFTPQGPPPVVDIDPRQLLQQQVFMQQQMYQQQENFKLFLAEQQTQFLQTLQKQQETFVQKDNVVKEILEDSRKKEDSTNALLEMMKNQSLKTKRIPCPKWTMEESYKSFSARLKHWDKNYQSKGKYLELMESLQETGRKTEICQAFLNALRVEQPCLLGESFGLYARTIQTDVRECTGIVQYFRM